MDTEKLSRPRVVVPAPRGRAGAECGRAPFSDAEATGRHRTDLIGERRLQLTSPAPENPAPPAQDHRRPHRGAAVTRHPHSSRPHQTPTNNTGVTAGHCDGSPRHARNPSGLTHSHQRHTQPTPNPAQPRARHDADPTSGMSDPRGAQDRESPRGMDSSFCGFPSGRQRVRAVRVSGGERRSRLARRPRRRGPGRAGDA
jgi:hypothetical protein